MSVRCRIHTVEKGGVKLYLPQVKVLFWWRTLNNNDIAFNRIYRREQFNFHSLHSTRDKPLTIEDLYLREVFASDILHEWCSDINEDLRKESLLNEVNKIRFR